MRTLMFIDCHTHTQFSAFDSDRAAVVRRALDAGVAMVNVGTKKETSQSAILLAHSYENVYAAIGLHPIHASHSESDPEELKRGEANPEEGFDYEFYKKLAGDDKVVAIGECGLDYYRIQEDIEEVKKKQKDIFIQQIQLAYEVKKPLMIHCRSALQDLIELLTTNYSLLTSPPGIMHFFSGTTDEAKKLLDMGFYFTFGGVVTFTSDYDEVVKIVPMDRILSETDAPYVAPIPYRGKRNEPAYVLEVVKKLAELKKVSVETIAERILENAESVFCVESQ
ncbi:MAG: TatD family hydrolase [Candidatus Jorgensenbacteria bacterium]|nr:TatD family hydrolase [Candidatus Jorgensenbacteria bacterium]